jgi:hypothetical protein
METLGAVQALAERSDLFDYRLRSLESQDKSKSTSCRGLSWFQRIFGSTPLDPSAASLAMSEDVHVQLHLHQAPSGLPAYTPLFDASTADCIEDESTLAKLGILPDSHSGVGRGPFQPFGYRESSHLPPQSRSRHGFLRHSVVALVIVAVAMITVLATMMALRPWSESSSAASASASSEEFIATIVLAGPLSMEVIIGDPYVDPGAVAISLSGVTASRDIVWPVGAVDTERLGSYTLQYTMRRPWTLNGTATRIVTVVEGRGCPFGCGNGTCRSNNQCVCASGWGGSMCTIPLCGSEPPGQCANKGRCVQPGVCSCARFWTGPTCESPTSSNPYLEYIRVKTVLPPEVPPLVFRQDEQSYMLRIANTTWMYQYMTTVRVAFRPVLSSAYVVLCSGRSCDCQSGSSPYSPTGVQGRDKRPDAQSEMEVDLVIRPGVVMFKLAVVVPGQDSLIACDLAPFPYLLTLAVECVRGQGNMCIP